LAYAALVEHDEAIADYNEAERLGMRDFRLYANRGNVYADREDYDRAVADFSEVLRLDSEDVVAFLNRGAALAAKGDYDQAIADFTAALALDPADADAYFNRGYAYAFKGEYNRAVTDHMACLYINPDLAAVYYQNQGVDAGEEGVGERLDVPGSKATQLDAQAADSDRRPLLILRNGNAFGSRPKKTGRRKVAFLSA
jgi:tetratricopeptide (TPR) repeat protein